MIFIALGIALWLASVVLALALCRAAAKGDEQLGYKVPPSPLERHFHRAEVSKLRTYSRLGIKELPPR